MNPFKIIGGDGNEYGPVSADDLRHWIAEGRANGQTRVQLEGSPGWRPLSEFPEFGLAAVAGVAAAASPAIPIYVKVFSILNMVFGGLGLLCTPVNFVAIPVAMRSLGNSPLMHAWLIFSSVWGLIGAAALLASGIGLWKRKPWARKLAVWYSVLAIVLGLAGIVVVVSAFGGGGGGNEMERAQRIGGVIVGVIGGLVGLVYNILLIIFLNKRGAKLATGELQ